MTTYQLYLILLGYLTEQDSDQSIKDILLQLYLRADVADSRTTGKEEV